METPINTDANTDRRRTLWSAHRLAIRSPDLAGWSEQIIFYSKGVSRYEYVLRFFETFEIEFSCRLFHVLTRTDMRLSSREIELTAMTACLKAADFTSTVSSVSVLLFFAHLVEYSASGTTMATREACIKRVKGLLRVIET